MPILTLLVFDKVALLIGNKDYRYSEKLGKLYHPTNDVRDIAGVLQSIGFKVFNQSINQLINHLFMQTCIQSFAHLQSHEEFIINI